MIADRGYDTDWFRVALENTKDTIMHPRPEVLATSRCDRCPKVFLTTFVLAAAVIFWLRNSMCLRTNDEKGQIRQLDQLGPTSALVLR